MQSNSKTLSYYLDSVNAINSFRERKSNLQTLESNFKNIYDYLDKINAINLFKYKKFDSCPHCENKNFIKYGKYKGIQRYKCQNNNCLKTFSSKTNSLFSYSKKSITLWMQYLTLMVGGFTIRECASALKINVATSFYWRHKLLVAQSSFTKPRILKDYVEVNKIIINENFKGNRNAKKIDHRKIFVVCAMDNKNNIFSKAVSRHTLSLDAIRKNFYYKLDKSAFISTFGDRYLSIIEKNHNGKLSNINIHKSNINIGNFTFRIYIWLKRFRGVATKYLENYLSWYILDFKAAYKLYNEDLIDLIKMLNLEDSYIKISNLKNFKLEYQYSCNCYYC